MKKNIEFVSSSSFLEIDEDLSRLFSSCLIGRVRKRVFKLVQQV